jgi:hypothetical protein
MSWVFIYNAFHNVISFEIHIFIVTTYCNNMNTERFQDMKFHLKIDNWLSLH